jgi:hypothetical protein
MAFASMEIVTPTTLDELLLILLNLAIHGSWTLHAQTCNQWNGEGKGLAGAGFASPEYIPPCQGIGNGVNLNGECTALTVCSECGYQDMGNAKFRKGSGCICCGRTII